MSAHPRGILPEAVIKKILITDGCWVWTGTMSKKSPYHRPNYVVTKEIYNAYHPDAPCPASHTAFRTCGNSRCVNPDHMTVNSRSEVVIQSIQLKELLA